MRTPTFLFLGILILAASQPACDLDRLVQTNPAQEKPRLVIALVDATASFQHWDDSLRSLEQVINGLRPRESFIPIAIDDQGFESDQDVLLELSTLNIEDFKAQLEKMELIEKVRHLKRPNPKQPRTDILGTLRHAAYFASRNPNRRSIVVVFSDMRQTPRLPTVKDARGLEFPADSSLYCFYVNASGWTDWESVLNTWLPIFEQAGLRTTRDDFFQKGDTKGALSELFP
jgi:hypothetical protein